MDFHDFELLGSIDCLRSLPTLRMNRLASSLAFDPNADVGQFVLLVLAELDVDGTWRQVVHWEGVRVYSWSRNFVVRLDCTGPKTFLKNFI